MSSNTLEQLFIPDITNPFSYISIVSKFPENFKNGETRVFDIFNYSISLYSQYDIECNMCVKYSNLDDNHVIRCYLTPAEHASLGIGKQEDKWDDYMILLSNKIKTLNPNSYPNIVKVEIDAELKELYIYLICNKSDSDNEDTPPNTLIPFYVPVVSHHTTTVEDIREYKDTIWHNELISYINAAAHCIDMILSTPAKVIDWDRSEIINGYTYTYYDTSMWGGDEPREKCAYISIEPCYNLDNFKAGIRCLILKPANSTYKNINNLSQNVEKARYIIEKISDIFGPKTKVEETKTSFSCYVPFPERGLCK